MEQIQRANRLYPSDTIFLKPTLLIPAPGAGCCPEHRDQDSTGTGPAADSAARPGPAHRDLSATDFLRRLDAEIGRSKAAAAVAARRPSAG